jgi:hypothetical protein
MLSGVDVLSENESRYDELTRRLTEVRRHLSQGDDGASSDEPRLDASLDYSSARALALELRETRHALFELIPMTRDLVGAVKSLADELRRLEGSRDVVAPVAESVSTGNGVEGNDLESELRDILQRLEQIREAASG